MSSPARPSPARTSSAPPGTDPSDTDPLIVSAVLAEDAQRDLEEQRRRWFPAARLVVGAHVTLFHHLPGDRADDVADALRRVVDRPGPALTVLEPYLMGRGVGLRLRSSALEGVRAQVAQRFDSVLTDQDARRWRPHVTVQNKVDKDTARATLAEIEAGFAAYDTTVEALALWRYRGGPWEAAGRFPFRSPR